MASANSIPGLSVTSQLSVTTQLMALFAPQFPPSIAQFSPGEQLLFSSHLSPAFYGPVLWCCIEW